MVDNSSNNSSLKRVHHSAYLACRLGPNAPPLLTPSQRWLQCDSVRYRPAGLRAALWSTLSQIQWSCPVAPSGVCQSYRLTPALLTPAPVCLLTQSPCFGASPFRHIAPVVFFLWHSLSKIRKHKVLAEFQSNESGAFPVIERAPRKLKGPVPSRALA